MQVSALEVSKIPQSSASGPASTQGGDLTLRPAKAEVFLDAGGSTTTVFTIANRTERAESFSVTVTNFAAGENGVELDKKSGNYDAKTFIFPEAQKFTLQSGEQAKVSVSIFAPKTFAGGELLGAVIFGSGEGDTGAKVVTRLGALIFAQVKNGSVEDGLLKDFSYKSGYFSIKFENRGNVYLNPYGVIEIRNLFGRMNKRVEIDPWFVLSGASRERIIPWEEGKDFWGSATLFLSPGYGGPADIVVKKVLINVGWKSFLAFVLLVVLVGMYLWKYLKHFKK